MLTTDSSSQPDPAFAELVQFSAEVQSRKADWQPDLIASDLSYIGAAPLMPLRDRDWVVLNALFHQDGMAETEADILRGLLQRCPEPCWEDDARELLKELLE